MKEHSHYHIPESSPWPLLGSVAITTTFVGLANWLHQSAYGPAIFFLGLSLLLLTSLLWFGDVIQESQAGLYNKQVDRSFRWAMIWFIFSEVCFFAVFFAALFYTRYISVPHLGASSQSLTHYFSWPEFRDMWPLLKNPDNTLYQGAHKAMLPWGLPALNTLVLLTSGLTITIAHWALKLERRKLLLTGLSATILLGCFFLGLQAFEYIEAYQHYNLTLKAGVYGSTFYLLTGFHGAHVTLGTVMLMVILGRAWAGHFSKNKHFAFEAVAWYWHFVDVVWLLLFVFVYWL